MIKLTVDDRVLAALKVAFPKPVNCAQRALDKYVAQLTDQIEAGLRFERTAFEVQKGIYSISTSVLANKGGQIGKLKTRMHQWLQQNNLSLIQVVQQGSNLTGKVSQVKLTNLVTVVDSTEVMIRDVAQANTDDSFLAAAYGTRAEQKALAAKLYPDLDEMTKAGTVDDVYDRLPVNVNSLLGYIFWLGRDLRDISDAKKSHYMRQAQLILQATAALGGKTYLQRRAPSAFGRTYYEGISVQNINKLLRRAVLGHCWEYDIRSSVIAWKLGYVNSLLISEGFEEPAMRRFFTSILYCEDKPDVMATVRNEVFFGNRTFDVATQEKMIKLAFTAIAFGARKGTKGWRSNAGHWQNPALVDIIKNKDVRDLFMKSGTVRHFIAEQEALDEYIFQLIKQHQPELLKNPEVLTPAGQISRAKVIAYRYQHAETQAMSLVKQAAAEFAGKPIATVHDAIFFKRKISWDNRCRLVDAMRTGMANPYLYLEAQEHEAFKWYSIDEANEIEAHKQRMITAEQLAKAYYAGRPFNPMGTSIEVDAALNGRR